MKSPLFLSFPNWIHSVLFLAVPAAEVMWPYICFTLTGPFYIIHYVQPQCPLLIRANPSLSWRAALTSVASAFPAQSWTALGRLDAARSSQEVRLGSAEPPVLIPPWCVQPPRAGSLGHAPHPSVRAGSSSSRRWGAWESWHWQPRADVPRQAEPLVCISDFQNKSWWARLRGSTGCGACCVLVSLHSQTQGPPRAPACFPDCRNFCKLETYSLGAGGWKVRGFLFAFGGFFIPVLSGDASWPLDKGSSPEWQWTPEHLSWSWGLSCTPTVTVEFPAAASETLFLLLQTGFSTSSLKITDLKVFSFLISPWVLIPHWIFLFYLSLLSGYRLYPGPAWEKKKRNLLLLTFLFWQIQMF